MRLWFTFSIYFGENVVKGICGLSTGHFIHVFVCIMHHVRTVGLRYLWYMHFYLFHICKMLDKKSNDHGCGGGQDNGPNANIVIFVVTSSRDRTFLEAIQIKPFEIEWAPVETDT